MTMTKTWEAIGAGLVLGVLVGLGLKLGLAGDCAVAVGPQAASRQTNAAPMAINLISV
ncbi:MAG: hypothetical protein NVS9B11_12120 [Candidatus Dormibacteraceae bacterium]